VGHLVPDHCGQLVVVAGVFEYPRIHEDDASWQTEGVGLGLVDDVEFPARTGHVGHGGDVAPYPVHGGVHDGIARDFLRLHHLPRGLLAEREFFFLPQEVHLAAPSVGHG